MMKSDIINEQKPSFHDFLKAEGEQKKWEKNEINF